MNARIALLVTVLSCAAPIAAADTVAPAPLRAAPTLEACEQPAGAPRATFRAAAAPTCVGVCRQSMEVVCDLETRSAAGRAPVPPVAAGGTSWEAAVVTGLADLIADRTKAEVIAWAEDVASRALCGITYVPYDAAGATLPAERWLPATCRLVTDGQLAKQLSTAVLAAAIRSDLAGLPRGVAALVAGRFPGPTKENVFTRSRLSVAAVVVTDAVELLRAGAAPLEVLAGIGDSEPLRTICRQAGETLLPECGALLAGLVVKHFGSVLDTTKGEFDANVALRVISRVLLDPARAFHCDVVLAFTTTTECNATTPDLAAALPAWLEPLVDLRTMLGELQPHVLRLLRATVELDVRARALISRASTSQGDATAIGDAVIAVLVRAWSLASGDAANAALDGAFATARAGLDIALRVASGRYAEAATRLVDLAPELGITLPESVRRYLAFIVDLASASDSAEVREAIEQMAAPLGGWRGKQDHLTLAVGAFPGVIGGHEWAPRATTLAGTATSDGVAAGLFAPVGIDFARRLGVFVSILDLGQLTWARIENDDKAEQAPTTGVAQVFSPGAYLHYALGDSPFNIGVGASYAPALRRFPGTGTDDADARTDAAVWRAGVFLAVDVTLLPLWVDD